MHTFLCLIVFFFFNTRIAPHAWMTRNQTPSFTVNIAYQWTALGTLHTHTHMHMRFNLPLSLSYQIVEGTPLIFTIRTERTGRLCSKKQCHGEFSSNPRDRFHYLLPHVSKVYKTKEKLLNKSSYPCRLRAINCDEEQTFTNQQQQQQQQVIIFNGGCTCKSPLDQQKQPTKP